MAEDVFVRRTGHVVEAFRVSDRGQVRMGD
jgi:hypothetical protein